MYLEIFLADFAFFGNFAGFRGNTWISWVCDCAKYEKPCIMFRKSVIIISLHVENKRVCGSKVTYTDQGNKKEQKKVFNSNNLVVALSNMVLCLLLWIKLRVGSAGWKCIWKKTSWSKDKNRQQNSTHIIFSAHPGFEVDPLWWEADALTAAPPLPPAYSPPHHHHTTRLSIRS